MSGRHPFRPWARMVLLGLALAAAPAMATLKAVEEAYELLLAQVQLPDTPDGAITVRSCATCKPIAPLRVSARTTWHGSPGSPAIPQAEALKIARAGAAAPSAMIYLYYDPATRLVHRVVLDRPGRTPAPAGTPPWRTRPTGGRP